MQGASSLEGEKRGNYVGAVAAVFLTCTLLVAAMLAFAPLKVREWTGLAAVDGTGWLLLAVALTSVYVFFSALLNAQWRVETLAALQLAGPGSMALLAYPISILGAKWIAPAIAVSATVSAGCALAAARRERRIRLHMSAPAVKHFFSISMAMLITGFVASTAVVIVRGNIIRTQGLAHAGLFDAAWSISMNQVTLVLASVQTYYLRSQRCERVKVNQRKSRAC